MPRPSKYVAPDTLGGCIRTARKHLRLSLAEVAGTQYSTSLISQIERNRVDPSEESLRFLAERLHLPFDELATLAHQQRASEIEARQYKAYEELRSQAAQFITNKNACSAIELLASVSFPVLPSSLRWRLVALRGQAYFEKRKFLKAKQDFLFASSEQPRLEHIPSEQQHEVLLLHLHLAGTYRELRQHDEALEEYTLTLRLVNGDTPSRYVAEAHWGLSLILFAQAHNPAHKKGAVLTTALEHAEIAQSLYRSIGVQITASAVTCQIARIERARGNLEKARTALEHILSCWPLTPLPTTDQQEDAPPTDRRLQEEASVVTVALCTLADIELEAGHLEEALQHVNHAVEISQYSYKLRRYDAHLMFGRVLAMLKPGDPAIEIAFRNATAVLEDTDRIAPRISAHLRLSKYLSAIGKSEAADEEQAKAIQLAELATNSHYTTSPESAPSN